jgi:hypothetical protein
MQNVVALSRLMPRYLQLRQPIIKQIGDHPDRLIYYAYIKHVCFYDIDLPALDNETFIIPESAARD